MTIRLYDKDVDMLDFSAVVKTCAQRENGYVVTLDQTAFFPEGGGQGADHGTLGGVQVLDARWSTWSARRWQSAARCAAMWTRRAGWT